MGEIVDINQKLDDKKLISAIGEACERLNENFNTADHIDLITCECGSRTWHVLSSGHLVCSMCMEC